MKTEVIEIEGRPTARGENKNAGAMVKASVQGFLDANPGAEVKFVSLMGNIQPGSFSSLLLVLLYEPSKDVQTEDTGKGKGKGR